MPAVSHRRRLTVHAGLAKCGSTSIQWLLAAYAPRLAARGIHVPLAATRTAGGRCHNNLVWEEMGNANYRARDGGWRALAEEIARSSADRFVISAEVMTGPWARGPCVRRLVELAAAARLDVDVVGYVRPQWRQIESHYSQFVARGLSTVDFDRFATELLEAHAYTRLDYNAVFAPFRAGFGAQVRVYPLRSGQPPSALLRHFLGVLGVGSDEFADEFADTVRLPRGNTRRGAMELEVRRRFWAATAALGRRRSTQLSHRLAALPALLDSDVPFAGFDGLAARAVMRRFEASNARFARDYRIGDGVLFDEPIPDRPAVRAAWADFSERQRRLVCRYVRVRTGVDLAAPAPAPRGAAGIATGVEVRMRLAARRLALAAGHLWRWWRLRGVGEQRARSSLLDMALRGRWR